MRMHTFCQSIALGLALLGGLTACGLARTPNVAGGAPPAERSRPAAENVPKIDNPGRVVHVLVALCDNENQGIVPVPAALGDGEDPARNLYWGAAYGVKTFFARSPDWEKLAEFRAPREDVLERVVFKHRRANVYLVADAYRGSRIKATIEDFFAATAGARRENVRAGEATLQISGGAALVAFVGHNGLMDFALDAVVEKRDEQTRDAVVLACASRQYFAPHLKKTAARPLLWTSNLMAPEAYILHDALEGWTRGESEAEIQNRAAAAYARYQRINVGAARRLLVTGW